MLPAAAPLNVPPHKRTELPAQGLPIVLSGPCRPEFSILVCVEVQPTNGGPGTVADGSKTSGMHPCIGGQGWLLA